MLGRGKYDALTTVIREKLDALGVFLIVVKEGGESGVSCQASPEICEALVHILPQVAEDLKRDINDLHRRQGSEVYSGEDGDDPSD